MIVSTRYGIELPQRSPSWFARQERQAPVCVAVEHGDAATSTVADSLSA